jgi:tetratricopeptide (TPR) repeat protein
MINKLKKRIAKNPSDLEANKNLGAYYVNQGNYLESFEYFRNVLLLEKNSDNFYNLGVVFHQLKDYQNAEQMYFEALKLNPNKSECYSNLGAINRDLQNFNQALVYYQKSIDLQPEKLIEYINYSTILINLKKYEDALAIIDFVLSRSNDVEDVLLKKYELLLILGKVEESKELFEKILSLFPLSVNVQWHHAQRLLLLGDYLKGWQAYESRWRSSITGLKEANLAKPKWLGDFSIEGKILLVHSEQGLGDTIQFARYLPLLHSLKAKIIFSVSPNLIDLFKHFKSYCQIILESDPLPEFDAYVPLMSLPYILGTTIDKVPNNVPYIFADSEKVSIWQELIPQSDKLKVGLLWSGGHRPDVPNLFSLNDRRNLPVEYLKYFKGVDAAFFSLQKGDPSESEFEQLSTLGWDGPQIFNYTRLIKDFSDTAALIENLDLVISVDTSTAHLAAAMGKPVWLLNRLDTCWRWLTQRQDSPWYPTIKIYRQEKANDWVGVVLRIRADLENLINSNIKS